NSVSTATAACWRQCWQSRASSAFWSTQIGSVAIVITSYLSRTQRYLKHLATGKSVRQSAAIHILQLPAEGYPVSDARYRHAHFARPLSDVKGRCRALYSGVGSQDQFLNRLFPQ